MRFLIALTTALVPAALSAQEAPAPDPAEEPATEERPMPGLVRAEDVSDATIYTLADAYDEAFWDSGETFGPIASSWEEIGEAEDVILNREGRVVGVSVDVGGFLGIGDKDVLLALEDIRLVPHDEDELVIVTRLSQDELEALDQLDDVFGDD